MKGFLCFTVLTIALSVASADFAGICKDKKLGKRINHPDTCQKYVVCIGNGVEMPCPEKTEFNAELEVCDWPERAGCSSKGSDKDISVSARGGSFALFASNCAGQPLGKHVKHASTCEKYVVCIGGGVEVNCPPTTHFNEELQVCDWPERAGCSSKGSDKDTSGGGALGGFAPFASNCAGQPLGKHVKHASTCEKYVVCIGGGVEVNCPPTTHFNEELQVCDWPERAGCLSKGSDKDISVRARGGGFALFASNCAGQPLGKHVKHASTCEKYVVCIGGGVEVNCPPTTHFNEELQVCDWPERAGCSSKGSDKDTSGGGALGGFAPFASNCAGQPLGKHVKHASTCEKYVVCIGGGVEVNCPPTTHFNEELQVCDWPERANCT